MVLLLAFSFLAGLITILSPCILSILPILLATSSYQERYRSLGIIIGLIVSFSFFTLTTASLVAALGISPDIFRYVAIATIIFFGLTMLIPSLELWITEKTSGLTHLGSTLQNNSSSQKTGFIGGILLGGALGLIWSPCAGPILATVTTIAATQGTTLITILMILSYSCGAALPMILIMYGSTSIINKTPLFASYSVIIRKAFGIIIIISALAIAFGIDKKLAIIFADYFPTLSLENNQRITKELQTLKKGTETTMNHNNDQRMHSAPELTGITDWINTQPLSLQQLRGKVVLLDFWTYSCINCIRTLPHIKQWYQTYKNNGLEIVGVHTPEFAFEKNKNNVQAAVEKFGLTYPIALDSNYATWQAYNNQYWPAHYLINKDGDIVYHHFGEGNYQATENKIRELLGLSPLTGTDKQSTHTATTPETYLGAARADRYHHDIVINKNHTQDYHYRSPLSADEVGLTGPWIINNNYITATDNNCTIDINCIAKTVNLVMESYEPQAITILMDGKPVPQNYYSNDATKTGTIIVHEPRMYTIINLKDRPSRHIISIICPKNINAYVFTFG